MTGWVKHETHGLQTLAAIGADCTVATGYTTLVNLKEPGQTSGFALVASFQAVITAFPVPLSAIQQLLNSLPSVIMNF